MNQDSEILINSGLLFLELNDTNFNFACTGMISYTVYYAEVPGSEYENTTQATTNGTMVYGCLEYNYADNTCMMCELYAMLNTNTN
jgi:hypothetical protein